MKYKLLAALLPLCWVAWTIPQIHSKPPPRTDEEYGWHLPTAFFILTAPVALAAFVCGRLDERKRHV